MNKFKERRKRQILDGICDLVVVHHKEFGITMDTVVEHFAHYYKPKAVRATEKRQRQAAKVRRHEVAKNAVNTRWERQREFLAAPTAKEKAKAKVTEPSPLQQQELVEPASTDVPDLI